MPDTTQPSVRTAAEIDNASRYVQAAFYALADHVQSQLHANEAMTAHIRAEDSDFVRINGCRVRQAGNVRQRVLTLRLIRGKTHAAVETTLTGVHSADRRRMDDALQRLRGQLDHLPEDPHLLYSTATEGTERHGDPLLPDSRDAVDAIIEEATGLDLVGIYAGGGIYEGFANSFGQRDWFSSFCFNFDFSVYERADKAVKGSYAGFEWEPDVFASKIASARRQRELLKREARTIDPGNYRVYLAPAAVSELLSLLAWGSFGLKSQRTRQSAILRLVDGNVNLHPSFHLSENTRGGVAAGFGSSGFARADRVPLVTEGRFAGSLVSPRSAAEFGVSTTGASDDEMPHSIDLAAGDLEPERLLAELGTGIWVNNLWYTNYSDRNHCRITGMTRFATFWVENGEVVAPLNVMRFDETLYRMFGDNLVGLTAEREMMLDADTYYRRSTGSTHLPGALINDFRFTL